jgi:hypothetical protein
MNVLRIGMARMEAPGNWQIGIWSVYRINSRRWDACATGPGTIGHAPMCYPTLHDAHLALTGEAMTNRKLTSR